MLFMIQEKLFKEDALFGMYEGIYTNMFYDENELYQRR